MQKVSSIEDLNGCRFVDVYVSTDGHEMRYHLQSIGFRDVARPERETLGQQYRTNWMEDFERVLRDPRTGLEADCLDLIPMEESQRRAVDIGFNAMSKVRIYLNGSKNIPRQMHTLLKVLNEDRQNFAVVNEGYTRAFVSRSEFYDRGELVFAESFRL